MPPVPSRGTNLMIKTLGQHLVRRAAEEAVEEAPEEEVAEMDAAGETMEEEMAVGGGDVLEVKINHGK